MKRRNVDLGKIRKMKRNKITDGSNTLLYIKFLFLWAIVITADFMLEFRFEFLWPFWLLLRSVHDSFKYKGLAFSVLFVCIAITSDLVCLFFIPVHWLFFAASTYVWVQYVWHTDKGICLPTIILWMLFIYLEAAIRWKDNRHMPHLDLCRPFAAHCIGYPVVTLGFGFKSYVGYRMRQRKQREVAKENEFYMQLLLQALPQDETTATQGTTTTNDCAQDESQPDVQKDPLAVITNNHNNNNVHKNLQTNTKSYNTNVNGHVGISTSSTTVNQSNGINHHNSHLSAHKTHRKSLEKDKFDSTNHSNHHSTINNNNNNNSNNNNSNYLYNNKTGSTTKTSGPITGTYNNNTSKDNCKLNDIIQTQRDHNHLNSNNKIEQIDKTTGILSSSLSPLPGTEKLTLSTDYQKCDYKNNIIISEYQNGNINDSNLIKTDKIINNKQNGNINNYDDVIHHLLQDLSNGVLTEKSRGRKNRLKQKDNHQHNNTTATTPTTSTITTGISSTAINQQNDIIINNSINYISQYQQTLPQICESCLRLENDNKKIKTELSHLKHIENDLRQKIDTNINYKNCLQAKQKENDELDKRILELNNSRQLDRQNLQNNERRLIDERRQRQSIESQLNNERKQRKIIEERAVRTECGDLCKMKKLKFESECNKLRRELQLTDDAKNSAEHQSRSYEQELRKMENEIRNREAQQGTEVLMSALAAMQDKNSTLEKNLSAETRVKLDLFSALGEAKRQLEIRESAIRNKDKEVHDLKAKIAQLLAVMPIHQMPTDSLCLTGSTSSMLRLNDTPPLLPPQQQQQQQQQQCCQSSSSKNSNQMSHQLGLSGLGQLDLDEKPISMLFLYDKMSKML